MPYFPNTTINWDNSPRAHPDAKWDKPAAHVVNPVMVGNSPAAFREACEIIKARLLAAPTMPKIITVNAWNEWPEGSVLEPETGIWLRLPGGDQGRIRNQAMTEHSTPHDNQHSSTRRLLDGLVRMRSSACLDSSGDASLLR